MAAPTKAGPVASRVAVRAARKAGDQAGRAVTGPVITGPEPCLPATRATRGAAAEAEADARALRTTVARAPAPGDPSGERRARRAPVAETDTGRESRPSAQGQPTPLQGSSFLAPERSAGARFS